MVNILSFVLSTDSSFNTPCIDMFGDAGWGGPDQLCDVFNAIEFITVILFTFEYVLRIWVAPDDPVNCDEADSCPGITSRFRYMLSFYAIVDLVCILPFYLDAFIGTELPAAQFLRMFRLLRFMQVEGRYADGFQVFSDIFADSTGILQTSGYVGLTSLIISASLYWMTEKDNPLMNMEEGNPDSNRFRSLLGSCYFTLLNYFGEYPLSKQHSDWAKVVSVFICVISVNIFAILTGVVGNGFQEYAEHKQEEKIKAAQKAQFAKKYAEVEAMPEGPSKIAAKAELAQQEDEYVTGELALEDQHATLTGELIDGIEGTWLEYFYDMLLRHDAHDGGMLFEYFLFFIIILNVIAYMLTTIDSLEVNHPKFAGILENFEFFSLGFFTIEYFARLYAVGAEVQYAGFKRIHYCFTFYAIIDFISTFPCYYGIATGSNSGLTNFIRTLRLLRLLKMDEYMGAFKIFDDIIVNNSEILAVTGAAASIMWVFFSSILYYTERNNPNVMSPPLIDSEGYAIKGTEVSYYGSIPDAMWITLLNLSGEYPLCDYTWQGKIVTAIVGIFSVGAFTIPVGILGAGFEQWIDESVGDGDEDEEEDEEDEEAVDAALRAEARGAAVELKAARKQYDQFFGWFKALPAETVIAMEPNDQVAAVLREKAASTETRVRSKVDKAKSYRGTIYLFTEGLTPLGAIFEKFVLFLIFLSVACTAISTVPSIGETTLLKVLEAFVVVIFSVEYLMRLYAAPEAEISRCQFIFSFYSIIDLLAILPWYIALVAPGGFFDNYDEQLRMLRMLRLLKLDKYVPSITLIDDAFRSKETELTVAGFVAFVVWIFFSCLLYLAEDNSPAGCLDFSTDPDNGKQWCDGPTQGDRFASVPMSLPYTLFLLSGDYPLVDWTFWGKVFNFFMVIMAAGIAAVPAGVLSGAFVDVLAEDKLKKKKLQLLVEAEEASGDTEGASLLKNSDGVQAYNSVPVREEDETAVEAGPSRPVTTPFQEKCYLLLEGDSSLSRDYSYFNISLIILNVVAVFLETQPEIGDPAWVIPQEAFDVFEWVSVAIFSIDLVIRINAAPCNPRMEYSVHYYLTSFVGFADLISVIPMYFEAILDQPRAPVYRVFRLCRLFQLEHYMEAFSLLDDVFMNCIDMMAATGILALLIWLFSATLFYTTEGPSFTPTAPNPGSMWDAANKFDSIPNSLYYTAIILGGEWCICDFTIAGKMVGMVVCVLGIALYAIPVGTIFESFGDVLEERAASKAEEEEERQAEIESIQSHTGYQGAN